MNFEIVGQKENWLIFEKDGTGIEIKSNMLDIVNIYQITKYINFL